MEKETRGAIETATQKARRLLEADFQEQLDGVFDVRLDGRVAEEPGDHLDAGQRRVRRKIVAAIEHKRAAGMEPADAVVDYLRDAAFTVLNRFVALKMLEARELVQPCVSQGEASSGFNEFCGLAPGVRTADGSGYRLYLECLFDELSTEVKVLFDRRDAPSALWPRRAAFLELLDLLNAPALVDVWVEDETIGWVYQYFNGQDERRAMRTSQVPHNSRELAVRNQFFTPRFVVQFLTDNTLGRLWYEMRDGYTALADQCDYMVRQPGETWAPRDKKDPRDLRVLDPACGSGHFLLYAFDLLTAIYEEAWADPASPASDVTGATLRADYPDLDALKLAMPGLILAHNLHGVDIDPRCAQIAQLALWMRAQRAFREFGVDRAARPLIRRSNIVIAEPMPGEKDLRDEFLHELKEDRLEGLMRRALDIPADRPLHTNRAMADSLTTLLETVWTEMALAGEMGVLLRIEQTLARGVEKARVQWEGDMPLFPISEFGLATDRVQSTGARSVSLSFSESLDFWNKAERLVLRALEEYAVVARGTGHARRRLFADDAAHGFALADLVSKKFDVVLMNPPFGAGTSASSARLSSEDAGNLYSAFVRRGKELGAQFIGCITDRTFMVQSTFADYRDQLLTGNLTLKYLVDLGWGVLDANVQTAAYVLSNSEVEKRSGFVDLRDCVEKSEALSRQVNAPTWVSRDILGKLPDNVLAYSLPSSIMTGIEKWKSLSDLAILPRGLGSNKASRTYLAWFEVSSARVGPSGRWRSLANGGEYSPYWREDLGVADWEYPAGKYWVDMTSADGWRVYDQSNSPHYFKMGLSFPKQSAQFHASVLPEGFLPTREGKAILPHDPHNTLLFLAILNSGPVRAFVRDTCGLHKQSGAIGRIPIPDVNDDDLIELIQHSKSIAAAVRQSFVADETSRTFVLPRSLLGEGDNVELDIAASISIVEARCCSLYGLDQESLGWAVEATVPQLYIPLSLDILSWSVGVSFGRFDLRLATGDRPLPIGTSLFANVPARSPGMLPDGDAPFMPTSGVFVDDPGHADDLAARVTAVHERVGEAPPAPDALRRTLAKDLFPAHIRMYSKSRRKAPIYWQLATPSASYSVWLYIHAFGKDSLFRVQNDYVAPKLAHERRELEGLLAEAGPSPTTAQSRAIEAQTTFVEELSALLDEVKRVAPLWDPDLDDGVILNFAPLWRLVPQNRSWQKELRAAWAALIDGDYDWARLSMRLWPERVVPKCAKDRSLAIAHDLEDVFWFEDAAGKWQARPTPIRPIDDLIAERTSPAVKAALQSLLEAPEPVAASGRGRRKKT